MIGTQGAPLRRKSGAVRAEGGSSRPRRHRVGGSDQSRISLAAEARRRLREQQQIEPQKTRSEQVSHELTHICTRLDWK
jgi:hypothetical protein